jgi:chromosomal replication initiation ATPase DnaA
VFNPGPVVKLLGGRGAYRRFVRDGRGEGHKEEYYEVKDQRFLGREEFGERGVDMVEERREPRRRKRALEEIAEKVARRFRIAPEVLRGPDRSWAVSRARTLLAYVSVRQGGFKVGEVAEYLVRDSTTISSLISRLSLRVHTEDQLRRDVEELLKIV